MRLFIVGVVVLAACGETRQISRWPNHRREKDEQIALLVEKTTTLEKQIAILASELRKLKQAAAPEAVAAPPPAPAAPSGQ